MTIKPIGSELTIQFKLAQCQRVEVLLILHIPKDFYQDNIYQLEVLSKRTREYFGCERVHQRRIKGFTLNNLTMLVHAFDLVANLNINCWMSKESHWQRFKYFLGWQNAILIASKCLLLALYFASNCTTNILGIPHLRYPWCHE
jgi:hypothetical protein